MHLGRRHRQFGIYGRSKRMHQVRPLRVIEPERGAALLAEIALSRADLATSVFIHDPGAEDADRLAAPHLQTLIVGRKVDGKTAATSRLAADGAIAKLVGIRCVTLDRKMYGSAPAGSFKLFRQWELPRCAR